MYTCGPTVYDYAHIGNLRSYISADILRRWLEYSNYKVKHVTNITDVGHMTTDGEAGEDKIEQAARRAQVSPKQITEKYTRAFFNDINALNIKPAWHYPRASEHVREMIKIIKKLLKNGFAYKVGSSVYFDLSKFSKYGELSGNTVADLLPGARVEVIKEKRQPYDFALWIDNPRHLLQWQAPWGSGYPGWHIECSAMAMKYLGETIDIHTGGEDNKFPHHESELAQSEAATGRTFARYWFHIKHLLINGEKMSKSKRNFYTLGDVLAKGFSPRAVRYLLLSAHYRDELNFTFDGLKAAETALKRLDEFWRRLHEAVPLKQLGKKAKGLPARVKTGSSLKSLISETREEFERAMNDDLNVPRALGALFAFVRKANARLGEAPKRDIIAARQFLNIFDDVFGLKLVLKKSLKISQEITSLVKEREKARIEKNWSKADELRKKIEAAGFTLEDTPTGPKVKKFR